MPGDNPPPFRVLHQKVVLRIDADQCLASGFTDITIQALEYFQQLRLHCRQMRVLMVRADGVPTRFDLADPLLRVVPSGGAVTAELFDTHHAGAAARSEGGEMCVTAAPQHDTSRSGFKPLVIRVEFALPRPVVGAHFVESAGAHFFASAHSPGPWGARLWLPCVDTGVDACPFDIYVTTHARHVVACCGVLKDHTVTSEAADQLDDNFANARIDAKDWATWTKTCEGVAEFVAETRRLPRSVVENESVKGADDLAAVTLREAFLAEWCNHQRLQKEEQQLPASACAMLENISGWEWSALRTSHYNLKQSVLPSSLVLAAGPFNVLPDPELSHVTHIGVPGRGRLDELRHTTACFPEIYNFIEGFAGAKAVPRRTYQQVFVDGLTTQHGAERNFGDGWRSGHGCTLLSSDLLHGPKQIETGIAARKAMAESVASHCFGNIITPANPESRWLVISLARFISLKYLGQAFGKTYYQFILAQDAEETSQLCDDYPPISDPWCGNTSTPALLSFMAKRGCMLLHMVESRVGADTLADCIRTLAQDSCGVVLAKKKKAERLTTEYFFDVLEAKARHSARKFVEKWIDEPHMPRLQCGYVWHERNNKTEIVLQQRQSIHLNTFQGPVDFLMHAKNDEPKELQLQMEDKVQQKEIANKRRPAGQTARAKAKEKKDQAQKKKEEVKALAERLEGSTKGAGVLSDVRADIKAKKKTVTVDKGKKARDAKAKKEAVDAAKKEAEAGAADSDDESAAAAAGGSPDGEAATGGGGGGKKQVEADYKPESTGESPVLWIRVDPNFLWPPPCFSFPQSLQNWTNQLQCERDVVAQYVAVGALAEQHGDMLGCVKSLASALTSDRIFYGVRKQIAQLLASKCANAHAGTPTEAQAAHELLFYFKSRFYSQGLEDPLPNDFADFGGYFVQKAVIRANASLRDTDDSTPSYNLEMLQELLQWNNNEFNPYDDSEYLSCIISAIAMTRVKKLNGGHHSVEVLKQLREEVMRYLQRELLIPTPRNAVGASCINALSHLDCLVHQQEVGSGAAAAAAEQDSSPRDAAALARAQEEEKGDVDVDLYCSCLHTAHSESVRTQAVVAVARLCSAGLWRATPAASVAAGAAAVGDTSASVTWRGAAAGIGLLLEVCEKREESEAVRTAVLESLHCVLAKTLAPTITPQASLRAEEAARLLRSDAVLIRLGWILNEGSAWSPRVRECCYQLLAAVAVPEGAAKKKIEDDYNRLVDVAVKARAPVKQAEAVKQKTYEERMQEKANKGPKTEMVNRKINITHKTMTSDKIMYHRRTMTAALPSSMVTKRATDNDWGDRQPVDICCDKCDQWWKTDKAGLSPEETDKFVASEKKWKCPTCKDKKAAKKAKKRGREGSPDDDEQGSPEAKAPRMGFKIKMSGFG